MPAEFYTLTRSLERTVPPAAPAITLAEVKRQLQLTDEETDLDEELQTDWIPAATDRVEVDAVRAFITQTWVLTLPRFPAGEVQLRRPPVQSVESVVYLDAAGVETTLNAAEYETHFPPNGPGVVRPVRFEHWPHIFESYRAVRITFKAGYGATHVSVPALARDAIKLAVHEMKEGCDYGAVYWQRIARIGWGALYG